MTRLAHLWDQSRCVSCGACIVACNEANYKSTTRENKTWGWIKSNIKRIEYLRGPRPMLLLLQCQHCESPPCVYVCPTGASYKDRDGLVKIREGLCIGCGYCVLACPYGARWIDETTGLPEKCMGEECLRRVARGEAPVCVLVCPAEARAFGDLDDPNSDINKRLKARRYIRLFEDKGLEPKYFIAVGP